MLPSMLDKLNLQEVKLTDVSKIQYRFLLADSQEFRYSPLLIVEFTGACGFGSGSNADACFMYAMIAAAFKLWDPICCILDLRGLKYEWGDMMSQLFVPPHDLFSLGEEPVDFPFAAVVSDLNREGLTSLISDEMSMDPAIILFDTIELAYERVIAIAGKTYKSL